MSSVEQITSLSIIIPVYNECDSIYPLYNEIVSVLEKTSCIYEVIFVNDGSTDATDARLQELFKTYKNVQIISHKNNYGQSVALLTGAKAAKYEFLLTMDGDGQNDPADIPILIKHFQTSNQVILGIRKKRDDNIIRKLSSRIGNTIRSWALQDGCKDTGCSLKLFSKQAFLNLPHFNHMHRFLPALFKRSGLKLVFIEVNHRQRAHGISKYGIMNRLFVGIHDLIGMRWLIKRSCISEIIHDK